MKELKDYLHLYLGCEVMDDQGVMRELRGVDVHECCTLAYNDIGEESEIGADTVKPILRPLSDMTEDEALYFINDIFKARQQFGHRIDNYKIDKGFLSFTYFNSNGAGGGNEQNILLIKNWSKNGTGEWIFNCSYSMNDVVWLLKKSFDLFGLIESGLAIDATTLRPKHPTYDEFDENIRQIT